jgi:predicted metal-dependent hydrolase
VSNLKIVKKNFKNNPTPYTLRHSKRARRIGLTVHCDGSCVVTAPMHVSQSAVQAFVSGKSQWIQNARKRFATLSHVIFVKKRKRGASKKNSPEYVATKARALALVTQRVGVFNAHYGFAVGKITVKDQKTRWGSCSKAGNLNFNYKIALLPEKLADYIVVHELCHLGEFNHSRAFWALVGETLPDYRALRSELRRVGIKEI